MDSFDIYDRKFDIRIFRKEKYTTPSSSILSIFTIVSIIALTIYFIFELLSRKNFSLVYNRNTTIKPKIDLTNTPIMFTVTDKTSKKIPRAGVFNIEVKIISYFTEMGSLKSSAQNIYFEPCNYEKHNSTYGEIFKTLPIDGFYCIPAGKEIKILNGILGDFPNGFSLMGIYINRCDPKIEICKSEKDIDFILSDFVVGLVYSSFNIDHYNYASPVFEKIENNGVFPMSYTMLKCYFYNLAQTFYETDYGLIFEEKTKNNFYVFESQSVDINMPATTQSSIFSSQSTVGYILIKCSENISFYFRSYEKAQTVIASIGGLIKSFLILSKLLFKFFTRKSIFVDLANEFFEIECEFDEKFQKNQSIVIKREIEKKLENDRKSYTLNNSAKNLFNSEKNVSKM